MFWELQAKQISRLCLSDISSKIFFKKKSKKTQKFAHQLLTKVRERSIFIFTVATLSCDTEQSKKFFDRSGKEITD